MKLDKYKKISDSEYLVNFFRSWDLNENLKDILKNIEKIKANNKEKIIIWERSIKWTLFWKTLSQFLWLSNSYDESRFSYVKDILTEIKKWNKVDFDSYLREKKEILHSNDLEKEFKKYKENNKLVPFLFSILTDNKNKKIKISSGNKIDYIYIWEKKILFDYFWRVFSSVCFLGLKWRSEAYKNAWLIIDILKNVKENNIKTDEDLKEFIDNFEKDFKLSELLDIYLSKGEKEFFDFVREILKNNKQLSYDNKIIVLDNAFNLQTFYNNLKKVFLVSSTKEVRNILTQIIEKNIKNFQEIIYPNIDSWKENIEEFEKILLNEYKKDNLVIYLRVIFASYSYKKWWEYKKWKYINRHTFLRKLWKILNICNKVRECDKKENSFLIRQILYWILNLNLNNNKDILEYRDKLLYDLKIKKLKNKS